MKALLISFIVGLFVGVIYGVIRVKSPCAAYHRSARIVGDGVGRAIRRMDSSKRIPAANVASAHILRECKDHQQRPNVQSAISDVREGVAYEFSSAML